METIVLMLNNYLILVNHNKIKNKVKLINNIQVDIIGTPLLIIKLSSKSEFNLSNNIKIIKKY